MVTTGYSLPALSRSEIQLLSYRIACEKMQPFSLRLQKAPDSPLASCPRKLPVKLGREKRMLWTIFVILLILWLLGFSFHVAGSLIHLLLVIAVVVLIINLLTGRRTAV